MERYPFFVGKEYVYDLIFIDGREREKCLVEAQRRLNVDGVAMIHDAERPQYKPFIDLYKYVFYEDGGHTAIMTNSEESNKRLEKVFAYCHTPS